MYRLHYLEVRYATIPPSPSLTLFVFRVLNRVRAGPIWIRGIRFKFQRQRGKLPFLFRRVVLVHIFVVHIFVVLSFGGRVVSVFAFQCRRLSFRGRRLESGLQPCRVPCEARGRKDFPQRPVQFGKREVEAPASNADEDQPAAADNKTAQLVDSLIPSPAAGTRERPKPCLGKNCPPPPPKPCKGKNCPPPPPPPCGPGTVSNGHGGCVAASRAGNDVCTTNPQASVCPASLVQNQYSNCAALRAQLQQAILELDRLRQAMNSACAANPQGAECISLTQKYHAAELQVESLRQRLLACRS